jgi:lipopolysaccharide biosynthesis protein
MFRELDLLQLKNNDSIANDENKLKKTLVLYVFHEYNNRVEHFFKYCIFNDPNVDFIIISNNKKFKINNLPANVRFLARDNIGYDFGGWSDALLINELYKNYDYFIFANSSVIGPFMNTSEKWTDKYINGLKKDNIKLFGSTINSCGFGLPDSVDLRNPEKQSHVQSYIFSMDRITLEYLIKCEIFSMTNYAKTYEDAICLKEINMSRKIIENDWNIGSLMNYYKGVDFRFKTKKPEDYNITFLGDMMDNRGKNEVWNLYEVVFIKGNRGIIY